MFSTKRTLALLIACALLIAVTPSAGAATLSDFTGTWAGTDGYYATTITFYDDYTYDILIEQGGQQVETSGTYSLDAAYLYFFPYGSQPSALSYYLSGTSLGLYDAQSGETVYLERQQSTPIVPATADVPDGLVGTWTGQNDGQTVFLTFAEDGATTLTFDRPDAPAIEGTFTVAGGMLEAQYSDNTYISQQFMLAGDTLVLATSEEVTTLTRYQAPLTPDAPSLFPKPPADDPPAAPEMSGLVGSWLGNEDSTVQRVDLTTDNRALISFADASDAPRNGTYTDDNNTLVVSFDDGDALTYQYILMGDTLILLGGEVTGPSTLTRQVTPSESE